MWIEMILNVPVRYTAKIGVSFQKRAGAKNNKRSYLVSLLCDECVDATILVLALLLYSTFPALDLLCLTVFGWDLLHMIDYNSNVSNL